MSALGRLLALPRFADAGAAAYRPGLDRMRALLAGMGHPERAFAAVHVAGTNGKGSTASFVAAIAHAAGLRVGLHTSPHLRHLGERMRVGGRPAPETWLEEAAERHAGLFARVEPSFFEATTALTFLHFAELAVELAVVEVGLGGRLDATNALPAETVRASVVTSIGWDHADLLGGTLGAIAAQKAGIARPGVPLLHGLDRAADAEAFAAVERAARAAGGPPEAVRETCRATLERGGLRLVTPLRDYGRVAVGLPGAHQACNAALAVRAAEVAVPGLGARAVSVGLAEVAARSGLRGRGERVAGVVLDVAHNADGWAAALAGARPGPGGRTVAVVGLMADKDAAALGAALARAGALVITTGLPGPRALSETDLLAALRAEGVEARPGGTVAGALAQARALARAADTVLATGSHAVVAEALDALGEPASATRRAASRDT